MATFDNSALEMKSTNKRGPKTSRTVKNGIRIPDPKTISGKVFAYCDAMKAKGTTPTRRQVLSQFGRTDNNPFSIATYYSNWKRATGTKAAKSVRITPKAKAVAKKVAKLKPVAKKAAPKPAAKKAAPVAKAKAPAKAKTKKAAPLAQVLPIAPSPVVPSAPAVPTPPPVAQSV